MWLRDGFTLFRAQPFAIMTLCLTLAFVLIVLDRLPYLGAALVIVLYPGLSVSFLIACRRITRRELVVPTVLVEPFRANGGTAARPLIGLGVLFFLAFALGLAGLSVLTGNIAWMAPSSTSSASAPPLDAADAMRIALPSLALNALITGMFWFAPVLVAWHGVPPVKALFFSVVAAWRNVRAFAVLAFALIVTAIAIAVPTGIVTAVLGLPDAALIVVSLPLVVGFAGVVECVRYASYRSTFATEGDPRTGEPRDRP